MKQKLAIFSLMARWSIWKVLGVLLGLMLLNGAAFLLTRGEQPRLIFEAIRGLPYVVPFLLALLGVSVLLSGAFRDKGCRQRYFFDRLRISSRRVYIAQALYNTACFLLLFLVETLSLLLLSLWNMAQSPESFNSQSIMYACYNSPLLHTFLPLSDLRGWLLNVLLIVGLGLCTASMPYQNRREKAGVCTYLMVLTAILTLYNSCMSRLENQGQSPVAEIVICVLIFVAVAGVMVKEGEEDE